MKPTDPLTTLFQHHLWANLRLLDRCTALNQEQCEAKVLGAYGSILETWLHIVLAERSYLSRIRTGQRSQHSEEALSMDEMKTLLQESGQGLIEWSARVQAGDTVSIPWDDGQPRDVPKSILLTQAINHATEHRAQIMVILTQLGIQPPDLDGWSYFEQQN